MLIIGETCRFSGTTKTKMIILMLSFSLRGAFQSTALCGSMGRLLCNCKDCVVTAGPLVKGEGDGRKRLGRPRCRALTRV